MFIELAKLTENAQIKIVVSGVSDGKLSLLVTATSLKGDVKSPISSPLMLTGTPAELDAELPAFLTQYADQTKSLFEQFQSQMLQIEAEAKEASEKAKATVAKKAATCTTHATKTPSKPVAEEKAKEQQGDLLELF